MDAGDSLSTTTEVLRLAPPERTLRRIVELQAERLGDRPCLVAEGTSHTYEGLRVAAARFAGTLAEAGVEPGDRVAILSENRWEILQCLLGCAWLGAVLVPINTASRGAQLQHILGNADPKVVAAEAQLLDRVAAVTPPSEARRLWRIGPGDDTSWGSLASTAFPGESDAVEPTPAGPGDPLAILYTSGTTGPSKGVVCPNAQFYWWGANVGGWLDVRHDDILYTCLPLFHTNALNAFVQALLHGARFTIGPRFSASRFWQRLKAADVTVTYLLGAMVSILASREPGPDDRSHRVRVALAPATPPELWHVFRDALRRRDRRRSRDDRDECRRRPSGRRAAAGLDGARDAGLRGAGRRRGGPARPGRHRGGARHARVRAVCLRERLLADARGDRRGLEEPVVSLRRPRRRGGRLLAVSRPHEGRDPTPRRERVGLGGRAGPAPAPARRVGRGHSRSGRARRGRRHGLRRAVRPASRSTRSSSCSSASHGFAYFAIPGTWRSSTRCRSPRTARSGSSSCASAEWPTRPGTARRPGAVTAQALEA